MKVQMLPGSAPADGRHGALTYAVFASDRRAGFSVFKSRQDFHDRGLGQPGVGLPHCGAPGRVHAPLALGVSHVVCLRSKKQVVRTNARRVVAAVTYAHAGRHRAVVDFPGHAIGRCEALFEPNVSVTNRGPGSLPFPAPIPPFYLRPKTLLVGLPRHDGPQGTLLHAVGTAKTASMARPATARERAHGMVGPALLYRFERLTGIALSRVGLTQSADLDFAPTTRKRTDKGVHVRYYKHNCRLRVSAGSRRACRAETLFEVLGG